MLYSASFYFANSIDKDNVANSGAKRMTTWISIKERFPEQDQTVLVTNGRSYAIAWFRKSNFDYLFMHHNQWEQYRGVTHWMPLPNLPEQDECEK